MNIPLIFYNITSESREENQVFCVNTAVNTRLHLKLFRFSCNIQSQFHSLAEVVCLCVSIHHTNLRLDTLNLISLSLEVSESTWCCWPAGVFCANSGPESLLNFNQLDIYLRYAFIRKYLYTDFIEYNVGCVCVCLFVGLCL